MAKLEVRATLAGMVAHQNLYRNNSMGHAQEGDQLYRGQPIVSIFDPTEMLVRCAVGEPDGAALVPGTKATVYFDAYPDLALPAHFEFASPVASPPPSAAPSRASPPSSSWIDPTPTSCPIFPPPSSSMRLPRRPANNERCRHRSDSSAGHPQPRRLPLHRSWEPAREPGFASGPLPPFRWPSSAAQPTASIATASPNPPRFSPPPRPARVTSSSSSAAAANSKRNAPSRSPHPLFPTSASPG